MKKILKNPIFMLLLGFILGGTILANTVWTSVKGSGDSISSQEWTDLVTSVNNADVDECSTEGASDCKLISDYSNLWECKYGWDSTNGKCNSIQLTGDGTHYTTLYTRVGHESDYVDCNDIYENAPQEGIWWDGSDFKDGYYMVQSTASSSPHSVKCDMGSDGGWTLFTINDGTGERYGVTNEGTPEGPNYSWHFGGWQDDATETRIIMGTNIDYLKPISGKTYGEMLQNHLYHQWKGGPANVTEWYNPSTSNPLLTYYTAHYGGSSSYWPQNEISGDDRQFLPFWGGGSGGGCCSGSNVSFDNWNLPFTFRYK